LTKDGRNGSNIFNAFAELFSEILGKLKAAVSLDSNCELICKSLMVKMNSSQFVFVVEN
jgi:hypothetical protein